MAAQRAAVTPLPCALSIGCGVTRQIRMGSGCRAESREHVPAVGSEVIADGAVCEPGTRGPGPATQHLATAERRHRIVAVHILFEAWVGGERRRRPFPQVPEQLSAT